MQERILWTVTLISIFFGSTVIAQQNYFFKKVLFDPSNTKIYEVFVTNEGEPIVLSSTGLWRLKNGKPVECLITNHDIYGDKSPASLDDVKVSPDIQKTVYGSFAQGSDSLFYFTANNKLFIRNSDGKINSWNWPYSWQWQSYSDYSWPSGSEIYDHTTLIYKIWIDSYGNLYAGTKDGVYIVEVQRVFDKERNIIKAIPKTLKAIGSRIPIYSFAQDQKNRSRIWMGTGNGLCYYNTDLENIVPINPNDGERLTITEIYTADEDRVWFSTLEKGMCVYDLIKKRLQTFSTINESEGNQNLSFSVKSFCYKSGDEFLAATSKSFPAIFNASNHSYTFLYDSVLSQAAGSITDIKIDSSGNLFVLKGDHLYFSNLGRSAIIQSEYKNQLQGNPSRLIAFIKRIELVDGSTLATTDYHPEFLKKIVLSHDQNNLIIYCATNDFTNRKNFTLLWYVDGYTSTGSELHSSPDHNLSFASLKGLSPGKYRFQLHLKVHDSVFVQSTELIIIINRPIWQIWWFWLSVIIGPGLLIFMIVSVTKNIVRRKERLKSKHEKQLLELEAKALRAQMNPHFIFNCLNSIKSLMQEKEIDKGVSYLTTFSKLIRTLFNNADKKEISLHDEIETCKLYLQLEAMRFDTKFSYHINIDETIDLKSVSVPALIIQPFIENAIWHGIVPKGTGGNVSLNVSKENGNIEIIVDDNGIGRESSQQNKGLSGIGHQSKGVNLTQSRLELDNLLQQRKAKLEAIDKIDDNGKASGTKVIIMLPQEE